MDQLQRKSIILEKKRFGQSSTLIFNEFSNLYFTFSIYTQEILYKILFEFNLGVSISVDPFHGFPSFLLVFLQ